MRCSVGALLRPGERHMPSSKTSHAAETGGIFLLLIGLLLGISLLTYHATDPSFSTVTTNPAIRNAIGKVGAVTSDIFFQVMGISAYFLPAVLMLLGLRRFRKEAKPSPTRRGFGWGLLIPTLSAWAELLSRASTPLNFKGGAVGFSINRFLIDYFGITGTYLVLFFFLLLGWMMIAPFSPSHIVEKTQASLLKGLLWFKERIPMKNHYEATVEEESQEDFYDSSQEREGEATVVETKDTPEDLPELSQPIPDEEGNEGEGGEGYQIPPLSLLSDPPVYVKRGTPEELAAQAQILKRKLSDFGVTGEVKEIHSGPVVTLFEFEPAPGIKLNRITTLADDLALAMRAMQVRIVPRIPGKSVVGIEIPNRVREEVSLKEILSSPAFARSASKLRIALGKDIYGAPVAADLSEMPHLLIAGATGSGKSVGLNSLILSILFSATPMEVKLLLIDPKMLELSLYAEIPHLFTPVITRPKAASEALRKMVVEMQRRYELLAEMGVRNIEAYNKLFANPPVTRPPRTPTLFDAQEAFPPVVEPEPHALPPLAPLPYIVVVIDELADLMVVASNDVEESIGRLAQMARAAGIHLVLATQRPSVDVLTGVIKANFPARVAYAVSSKTDSRTILDTNGAEQLLGKGDMLYLSAGTSKLLRVHGAYVSEEEVKRIVAFIRDQAHPHYEQLFSEETPSPQEPALDDRDDFYEQARELVISTGQASASFIQRRLRVGYPRAARMIEMMEEDGFIGPAIGSKPREILIRKEPIREH